MYFLKSDRLSLRRLKTDDVDTMYRYRNDPRCSTYQRGQLRERDKIALLVEKRKDDVLLCGKRGMFAIEKNGTCEMVGEISLLLEENTLTMGYTVAPLYQRRGYAYEMISLLLSEAFSRIPDLTVVCRVIEGNEASQGLLLKLGFVSHGYCEETDSLVFTKKNGGE